MRAFAIGDLILQGTPYRGRCWCLSACGLNRTHGRRRGATLQKFSTTGFFRVHGSLLESYLPLPVPIIYWELPAGNVCRLRDAVNKNAHGLVLLLLKPVSPNFSPGRATMNIIRENPGGQDAQTYGDDLYSC